MHDSACDRIISVANYGKADAMALSRRRPAQLARPRVQVASARGGLDVAGLQPDFAAVAATDHASRAILPTGPPPLTRGLFDFHFSSKYFP